MKQVIGLIGGASGKELTEKIQESGYKVALLAGKNGELGTSVADYVLTTDLRNINTIRSYFDDLGVKHLIVGTGHRFAFELAKQLEMDGIIPNINTRASSLAKEKRLYKDFITEKGFLTPAYVSIPDGNTIPPVGEIVKTTGLPCVVKATIDTILPQKAESEEDIVSAVAEVIASGSPVVVEQFIRGIDITVFVSAGKHTARALPICYYSKAEDNNMKGFSREEYLKEKLSNESEQKIRTYCEQLVLASEFDGLPRVDLMAFSDGTAYVLEVNSVGVTGLCDRHAAYCKGTVLALRKQGIDVAEIAVKTALQKFGLE